MPLNIHNSCHCLAWGPEGDLYFDHGDPLLDYGDFSRPDHFGHWTIHCQPEGTTVPYSGSGGVFRIHPDGSDFRQVRAGCAAASAFVSIIRGTCSPMTTTMKASPISTRRLA